MNKPINFIERANNLTFDNQMITEDELRLGLSTSGQTLRIIKEIVLIRALQGIQLDEEETKLAIKNYCIENKLDTKESIEDNKQKRHLSQYEFEYLATRGKRIVKFREERWGNLVNSIYLQKKENYDLIKYKCFISTNYSLMQEVYFRIKDDEIDWKKLADQLGFADTYIVGPVRVNTLDKRLYNELKKTIPNKILPPLKLDEKTLIVELIEIEPAKLNDNLRSEILRDEFEKWYKQQLVKSINSITRS